MWNRQKKEWDKTYSDQINLLFTLLLDRTGTVRKNERER